MDKICKKCKIKIDQTIWDILCSVCKSLPTQKRIALLSQIYRTRQYRNIQISLDDEKEANHV